MIGILLPELRHTLADPYFGEVISGVCDRAAQLGNKVTLESARPDFIRERKHLELFERRFVDGVLCIGFDDRHDFLGDFAAAGHPMLVVNNRFDGLGDGTGVVLCDYAAGADRALAYLDQLGHRRVGMIYGSRDVHTSRLLVDAFEKHHHAFDPSLLEEGRFAEEPGQAAAAALLDRHPDLTALFCGNDKMALGAIRELTDRGLRVPEDVSVIGFDDLPYARFVNPALSTVHLPFYEVGDLACERLVERIRGRKKTVDETLPTRLVIRESTARAAAPPPTLLTSSRFCPLLFASPCEHSPSCSCSSWPRRPPRPTRSSSRSTSPASTRSRGPWRLRVISTLGPRIPIRWRPTAAPRTAGRRRSTCSRG